jgi:hypothetical protein
MREFVNIGNLDLCFYRISFCSWEINIQNYHISFLKILLFEVRKVERDESIQFDTNSPMVPFRDISK